MVQMDDVQLEKSDFTEKHLKPLLVAALAGDVVDVEYLLKRREEFVEVTFANGYSRRACVTGDSLLALVEDVIVKLF